MVVTPREGRFAQEIANQIGFRSHKNVGLQNLMANLFWIKIIFGSIKDLVKIMLDPTKKCWVQTIFG